MVKGKARLRAVDISQVEDDLASVRTEQIIAGSAISQQTDDQLFFVDQKGVTEKEETKKLRERGLLYKRPLKIDEILKPQSKIPAMVTGMKSKGDVEKKIIDRKAKSMSIASAKPSPQTKPSKPEVFDIWNAPLDGMSTVARRRSEPPVKVKAVKVPMAGASYRPTPENHQELLEAAAEEDLAKERAKEELEEIIPPAMLTGAATSTIDAAVEEILRGESESIIEEDEEESDREQSEPTTMASPVIKKVSAKKTKAERRKEKFLKEYQKISSQAEREKRLAIQLESLKSIAKQVRQSTTSSTSSSRKEKATSLKSKLKRINGGNAFVPMPLEVQLPEELSSTLRQMKQEGNLVMDRFKSLQERALVETTAEGPRKRMKRNKLRLVEPNSYKN